MGMGEGIASGRWILTWIRARVKREIWVAWYDQRGLCQRKWLELRQELWTDDDGFITTPSVVLSSFTAEANELRGLVICSKSHSASGRPGTRSHICLTPKIELFLCYSLISFLFWEGLIKICTPINNVSISNRLLCSILIRCHCNLSGLNKLKCIKNILSWSWWRQQITKNWASCSGQKLLWEKAWRARLHLYSKWEGPERKMHSSFVHNIFKRTSLSMTFVD